MESSGYSKGERVVTRRGKTGEIVEVLGDGNLMVRFGSYDPIQLRPSQVVTEAAYRSMQVGGRVNASNQRFNGRP